MQNLKRKSDLLTYLRVENLIRQRKISINCTIFLNCDLNHLFNLMQHNNNC